MNEEIKQLEQITQQDKKAKKKFAVILILCTLAGGVFGVSSAHAEDLLEGVSLEGFTKTLAYLLPYLQAFLCILATGLFAYFYKKGLHAKAKWDGDINEEYYKMESNLGIALAITNLFYIAILTLFGMSFSLLQYMDNASDLSFGIWFALDLGSLVYCLFFTMYTQKKVVNLEKLINPEKEGSIYDTNFQKKWLNSCDELEQLCIYKSGYASFKCTNATCLILWLITIFTSQVFHTGLYPVLLIGIIWFVSTLSFQLEAHKLDKQKIR